MVVQVGQVPGIESGEARARLDAEPHGVLRVQGRADDDLAAV